MKGKGPQQNRKQGKKQNQRGTQPKNSNLGKANTDIYPKLSQQQFELIIKLVLYKYCMESESYLNGPGNVVLRFKTIAHMFHPRAKEIKEQSSKNFVNHCKRITEINNEINNNTQQFDAYKKELATLLKIEDQYLVSYFYDDESDTIQAKLGVERTQLLFEFAKAVGKFKVGQSIMQEVELNLAGRSYVITPRTVVSDLNYPPLYKEVWEKTIAAEEHPEVKRVFDYEVKLASLIWKQEQFCAVEITEVISLHNVEPESALYLPKLGKQKSPLEITDGSDITSRKTSGIAAKITPEKEKKLDQFFLSTYLRLSPHFEYDKSLASNNSTELNAMISFANFPEHFDKFHELILTQETIIKYGEAMFKSACYHGNIKLCRRLIELGVDPRLTSETKVAALLCAAMGGSIEVFELLIRCGITIAESLYGTFNVYDVSLSSEQYEFAMYLEKHYPYQVHIGDFPLDVLSISIATRDKHAIESLVNHHGFQPTDVHLSATLNHRQLTTFNYLLPRTAEHHLKPHLLLSAVFEGLVEQTELLLRRRINPNCYNAHGYSTLSISLAFGYSRIAELLLEYGADPNKEDTPRSSPLRRATYYGSKRAVLAIIKAGGDVSNRDNNIRLFELAVSNSHINIAVFFIENNYVSPNDLSSDKQTLFEMTLKELPSIKLVRASLAVKDVSLRSINGDSLLALALFEQCSVDVIEALASAHPDVDPSQHCYHVNDQSFQLRELIESHPETKEVEKLFNREKPAVNELKPDPIILEKKSSHSLVSVLIPAKDRLQISEGDGTLDSRIAEYQLQRDILIKELTALYEMIAKNKPELFCRLDNPLLVVQSAPNRSLESRIARLRSLLSSENVVANITRAPLFFSKTKSDPQCATYTGGLTYKQLEKTLGLTHVFNDNRYALVTKQLDTLIKDMTLERLFPFKGVLAAPMINSKNGLKDIRGRNVTASIQINGKTYKLNATFCMKARTKDRILVAQLFPLRGETILLFPFRWLRNGFHDSRYDGVKHFEGGEVVADVEKSRPGVFL